MCDLGGSVGWYRCCVRHSRSSVHIVHGGYGVRATKLSQMYESFGKDAALNVQRRQVVL